MSRKGLIIFLGILFCLCGCRKESPAPNGVLFDFEQDRDLDAFRWHCGTRFSLSEKYARHGRGSLELSFFPSREVGFSTDQVVHDWRHARSLVFFVYNPSSVRVPLHVEISDGHARRSKVRYFGKWIYAEPGENRIVIPIEELVNSSSKTLDVGDIKGFYIFMKNIKTKTTLYFDYFRLVKENALYIDGKSPQPKNSIQGSKLASVIQTLGKVMEK